MVGLLSIGGTRRGRALSELPATIRGWIETIENNETWLLRDEQVQFEQARLAIQLDLDLTTRLPKERTDVLRKIERRRRLSEAEEAAKTALQSYLQALVDENLERAQNLNSLACVFLLQSFARLVVLRKEVAGVGSMPESDASSLGPRPEAGGPPSSGSDSGSGLKAGG